MDELNVKILELLKENPNYSAKTIADILLMNKHTIRNRIQKLGIKRDRFLLQRCNNTQRSFDINITENAEQIILGSILGDGYIGKYNRETNSKLNLNSFLYLKHSLVQKDYCIYKSELLNKENIKNKLTIREKLKKDCYIKGRLIKDNGYIELKSRRAITFNKYRDLFYENNKFINDYIFKLNAFGLAIWFMDDGSKHTSGYYLHTNCFNYEDHLKLCNMLLVNFNISTSIHTMRNIDGNTQYAIYIRQQSVENFNELIKPYICDSMKYKLITGSKLRESGKI